MQSQNVVKANLLNGYYHVSSQSINKELLFKDESDYRFFSSLFERYLLNKDSQHKKIISSKKIYDSVEVIAFCIMPDGFHLLVYQIDSGGVSNLMHNIMTNYRQYYSDRYKKSARLFDGQYKTQFISSDDKLLHISRYIHIEPCDWIDYPHSSLRAYLYDDVPCWMKKSRIVKLYGSAINYLEFLKDYQKTSV